MQKELVKVIEDSLKALGLETIPSIEAEVPPNDSMGDLATPVAMSIAALLKKSPRKIAEELVNSIKDLSAQEGKSAFEKIDIAGPGFINFTFSKEYLYSEIK